MRFKLSYKIFAVFFLTVVVIVTFMVLTLRFFLYRNFADYVTRVELEKTHPLITALGEEYRLQGGWDPLEKERRRWRRILFASLREKEAAGPVEPQDARRHEPEEDREVSPGRSMGPPSQDVLALYPRLFLLDAHRRLVAGKEASESESVLQAVEVEGQTVGWLGLQKREPLKSPMESAFLQQQYGLFYMVGGGILLITALVSLLLARHLLAPIKLLMEGTRAMKMRDFGKEIPVRSKDELGQLAADFNLMARNLEKYEQMRRQWISDIAHELRTPLAVLQGEIEAIQDGVREMSRDTLDSLHTEVRHVGKIVNDLHELSLTESETLSLRREPVQPVSILEETVRAFQSRLEQGGIRIVDELGDDRQALVSGDADRLRQVFTNLLENTVRYTRSPGSLRISQEGRSAHLVLVFEDSGPGVPEASLNRLFDRLYRIDKSRSRTLGGTGLGLSICKSIVEAHGGKIRADNVPEGGGLRIEITLPLAV